MMGLFGKEVSDGSPTDVLGLSDVMAVGPDVNLLVLLNHFGVCRTVITNQYLIDNVYLLSLLSEGIHQIDTQVVIGGNQDG